eukprot:TRINITY_DN69684_c0_g1_i1.p1 TRINITY_DN69684_c0_g1~~TRINITY_DN69684_c0_g1_i1.p1  ORF type:complete len:224 (+),score=32.56 TRINITY_DN69684_c0_g1_i1:76-747(+)
MGFGGVGPKVWEPPPPPCDGEQYTTLADCSSHCFFEPKPGCRCEGFCRERLPFFRELQAEHAAKRRFMSAPPMPPTELRHYPQRLPSGVLMMPDGSIDPEPGMPDENYDVDDPSADEPRENEPDPPQMIPPPKPVCTSTACLGSQGIGGSTIEGSCLPSHGGFAFVSAAAFAAASAAAAATAAVTATEEPRRRRRGCRGNEFFDDQRCWSRARLPVDLVVAFL